MRNKPLLAFVGYASLFTIPVHQYIERSLVEGGQW